MSTLRRRHAGALQLGFVIAVVRSAVLLFAIDPSESSHRGGLRCVS